MDLALAFVIIGVLLIGALTVLKATDPKQRIALMPDDVDQPPDMWPIIGGNDGAEPYLRGSSSAGRLSGRR
jgi:hypothetical protein